MIGLVPVFCCLYRDFVFPFSNSQYLVFAVVPIVHCKTRYS